MFKSKKETKKTSKFPKFRLKKFSFKKKDKSKKTESPKFNKKDKYANAYKLGKVRTHESLSVKIDSSVLKTKEYFKKYFTRFNNGYQLSASLFVLYIACIFPFVIQPTRYSNITITKLYTFWLGCTIFCLLPGIHYAFKHWHLGRFFLWLTKTPTKDGKYVRIEWKKLFRAYEVAIILFLLWCFISMCINPTRTVNQNASSGYVSSFPFLAVAGPRQQTFNVWFFYMIAVLYLGRFYKFHKMDIVVFAACCALVSIYALFQWHGHDFLALGKDDKGKPSYDGSAAKDSYFFATISQGDVAGTYLGISVVLSSFVAFSHFKEKIEITLESAKKSFFSKIVAPFKKLFIKFKNVFYKDYVRKDTPIILFSLSLTLGVVFILYFFAFTLNDKLYIKPFYLVVIVGLVIFCYLLFFIKANKLFKILIFCLVFGGFYLVHTDGAFVGILGVILFTPFFLIKKKKIWLPVAFAVLVGIVLALPLTTKMNLPFNSIGEAGQIVQSCLKGHCKVEDSMGTGRIGIWRGTLLLMNDKPITYLTGYGPGNFGNVTSISGDDRVVNADEAHNEFLHTLFEQGIIGILLELLLFALILYRFTKLLMLKRNPFQMAIFCALIFCVVQMFFDISTAINDGFVWTICGMSAGISYRYIKKVDE